MFESRGDDEKGIAEWGGEGLSVRRQDVQLGLQVAFAACGSKENEKRKECKYTPVLASALR